MSIVEPPAHAFYHGIAHSIFAYDGTKPLTDQRRQDIRAMYMLLLNRAKKITAHKSGWVASIEWRDLDDAALARALDHEMFIFAPVPACDVEKALRAIFAE